MVKCILTLSNKDEWVQHITEIVNSRGEKSDEELLKEIVTFDFKFETILEQFPISLTEKQILE